MKTTLVFYSAEGNPIWSDSWVPLEADAFYGSEFTVPPGSATFRLLWSDETKDVEWHYGNDPKDPVNQIDEILGDYDHRKEWNDNESAAE